MLPVLFGLPLVLAPLHIAFLELVIDPACSLVFEAEDGDPDLMNQPPRPATASLLSSALVTQSLLQGGLVTAWWWVSTRGCWPWTWPPAWPAAPPSWCW